MSSQLAVPSCWLKTDPVGDWQLATKGRPMARLSALVRNLTAETAFTVLAAARALKAQGKDVVELEIGDSPFPSTPHAKRAGILAIEENQTGYCPSLGLPQFRVAAAQFVSAE